MTLRDSSTYQAILDEGRAEGEAKGRRDTLIAILEERFGQVPAALLDQIRALTDQTRLRAAI